MNCPYCGRINPDDAIFCPSCGTAIHLPAPKKSGSNIVTIVIALVVIMVALSIVLSTVMYVMVLGIGGGSPPLVISMTKSGSATNWTATVVALIGASTFSLSDIRLTVFNHSLLDMILDRSPLSTMTSGVYYSGVVFQDESVPGYLNVGDNFVLDKSRFVTGSTLTLTDLADTVTYSFCVF